MRNKFILLIVISLLSFVIVFYTSSINSQSIGRHFLQSVQCISGCNTTENTVDDTSPHTQSPSLATNSLPTLAHTDVKPKPSVNQHKFTGTWAWVWSEKNTYVWGERAFLSTNMRKDPVLLLIALREQRPNLQKRNYKWYCHVHTTNSSVKPTCTGEVTIYHVHDGIDFSQHWYTKSMYFVCPLNSLGQNISGIVSLQLSSESCESSKMTPKIPVVTNKDEQHIKRAGLCLHKPLFKVHNPQDIVQYIEIHKLFGVELFIIYIQDVSQSVRNILESYVAEGTVDLIEWNLKADMSRISRDYGQIATIHECLYRNRGRVKYLGFSDFDEVFMPRTNLSLPDILDKIDGSKIGSFRFLHVFMHESSKIHKEQPQLKCNKVTIPVYFKKYHRSNYDDSRGYTGINNLGSKAKVFVKPEGIIGLTRHSMYLGEGGQFAEGYKEIDVSGENALLFHYRNRVPRGMERRQVVTDFTMDKYKSKLMSALNDKLCA